MSAYGNKKEQLRTTSHTYGMQDHAAYSRSQYGAGRDAGSAGYAAYSNGAQGAPAQSFASQPATYQAMVPFVAADGNSYMLGPDGVLYRVAPGVEVALDAADADNNKRKRGPVFWICIVIAVLCLLAAAYFAWSMLGSGGSARQGDLGDLSSKTDSEIQAQIDDLVQKSMFNISIASQVDFDSATSAGEWKIENPATNAYLMHVVVAVEDTGQTIYETGIIEPNHHIQSDVLSVALPAGTYNCVARFYALDPETENVVGQTSAKIKVNVLS